MQALETLNYIINSCQQVQTLCDSTPHLVLILLWRSLLALKIFWSQTSSKLDSVLATTACVVFILKAIFSAQTLYGATCGFYWLVGRGSYWIWTDFQLQSLETVFSFESWHISAQEGAWVRCSHWGGTLPTLGGSPTCRVKPHLAQLEHFLNYF